MISEKAKSLSTKEHVERTQSIGRDGESRYYSSCKFANRDISKTSRNMDINHADFIVKGKTVDVKGLKPTHKQGLVVLEIKNVKGENGWCSESGPQWIAFDFSLFFVEVLNEDLIKIVKNKCNLEDSVSSYSDCLYKGYTRNGRKDLITMVSIIDIVRYCRCKILPVNE